MLRLFAIFGLLMPLLTFFEKNKQRYPVRADGQWNEQGQWSRRRSNNSPTVAQFTLHTYEADLGTRVLSGATYLLTRTTPGSYHWLFDVFRQHIHLAPWSSETWHSKPTNNWASSASAMMRAHDWPRLNRATKGSQLWEWRQNIIYGFALAAAHFSAWLVSQGRNPVPKRILTTAQALRREEGFVMHRDTDPGRRTDPANPKDEFPWDEFFIEYDRLLNELLGITQPELTEEDMNNATLIRNRNGGATVLVILNGDRSAVLDIRDTKEAQAYKDAGVKEIDVHPDNFKAYHELFKG